MLTHNLAEISAKSLILSILAAGERYEYAALLRAEYVF